MAFPSLVATGSLTSRLGDLDPGLADRIEACPTTVAARVAVGPHALSPSLTTDENGA